ncbi:TetR/AcrR family transcriptional regulator [Halodesulfovibrio sp. MK-HDV]|uniref:TetR/AcrR family transcriptional regulator n=1 Tax=Halodesulfovibrio sp. MK-HDV TaxID=2599925 RepID=UPI00136855B1|nr:TetR/AcrR family transcriptional regulator [Halodesulfovibrio sp. MK-HDV]
MTIKITRKQKAEQKTRHSILESGVSIIQTHGLENFTMHKVANQTGIAKGTLYLYFKNKNELLLSVAGHCFEPLSRNIRKVFASDINPLDKLEKYIHLSFTHIEQNKAVYYELQLTFITLIEKDINDKTSTYWEMINIFARTFEDGISKKLLRPMDANRTAIFFIDSIDGAMTRRIVSTVGNSAEDDAHELLNIYLHGLAL